MLTITGNGRLSPDPELRKTTSGKSVLNLHVASDRRNRDDGPDYVVLVLWESHAEAAHKHLVKGQASRSPGAPKPAPTSTRTTSRSPSSRCTMSTSSSVQSRATTARTPPSPTSTEFTAARADDVPF